MAANELAVAAFMARQRFAGRAVEGWEHLDKNTTAADVVASLKNGQSGERGAKGPPPPPAPVASGEGSILDVDGLLWCEDVWNEEREREAIARTSIQGELLWSSMAAKYERGAARAWDSFYKRNGNNFFKDRHYLDTVFSELRATPGVGGRRKRFLEVGCGVGNAFLPVMAANPDLDGCAIDFASSAIRLLHEKPAFQELVADRGGPQGCSAHVCDITKDEIPVEALGDDGQGCDVILLLYCLSALSPETMRVAVSKLAASLRPGGVLLFRDYGRYDEAQLRFGTGHRLAEHFYVKQDGTRVFYFTTEDLRGLMCNPPAPSTTALSTSGSNGSKESCHYSSSSNSSNSSSNSSNSSSTNNSDSLANSPGAGLEEVELSYIRRQYANRADQKARFRVWVHGKFRKPG